MIIGRDIVLNSYHHAAIRALAEYGLATVVIGGMAVAYYDAARVTRDLDLWLEPLDSDERKRLLCDALATAGRIAGCGSYKWEELYGRLQEKTGITTIPWGWDRTHEPFPAAEVELHPWIPNVTIPFEEAARDAVVIPVADLEVRIISRGHMIELKQVASVDPKRQEGGRAEIDRRDLRALGAG